MDLAGEVHLDRLSSYGAYSNCQVTVIVLYALVQSVHSTGWLYDKYNMSLFHQSLQVTSTSSVLYL